MRRISVTKIFTFDAAHRLNDYDGPCANIHGHTYKLEVTVGVHELDYQDMVIDFSRLKEIVENVVLERFDHVFINDQVNYNPTAENMALDIHHSLCAAGLNVDKIRLWETPTSYAEVRDDSG